MPDLGPESWRATEKPEMRKAEQYLHWMELRVGGRQKNQSLRGGQTAPWRYSLPFSIFCELSKEEKFVVDTFYNKGYNNSVNVSDLPVKGRLFSNFCWS